MKLDEVELRNPSFDRFPFYYTSIFMILQPKKFQDHDLIFVITVEWISPVKHRVHKRWPK